MNKKMSDILSDVVLPTELAIYSSSDPSIFALGLLTFLYGSMSVAKKWQAERMHEVAQSVGLEKLRDLILRDDKSRDVLHRILMQIMDEHSQRKRDLYYQYVKGLYDNKYPAFDYHSKLITVMNLITFEELDVLRDVGRYYEEVVGFVKEKQKIDSSISFSATRGANVEEFRVHKAFEKYDDIFLENVLNRLSNNYGLIVARYGRFNGTFYGPIEDFGFKLIDYLELKVRSL